MTLSFMACVEGLGKRGVLGYQLRGLDKRM